MFNLNVIEYFYEFGCCPKKKTDREQEEVKSICGFVHADFIIFSE